jgi:NAD(P)-dependent dehydrogenase (short-subunit alcohol dehydrogenase family)
VTTESGLEGRIALVTGAGRGIGRQVALTLADAGCVVLANDILAEGVDALAGAPRRAGAIHAVVGDLSTGEGVADILRRSMAHAGRVDILVNNAAVLYAQPFTSMDLAMWDRTFEVNVKAVVRTAQQVLPGMRDRNFGRIINISSIAGHIPRIGLAAYGAAKAAVSHLTRVLALENAAFGITANLVAPGPTSTDIANQAWGHGDPDRVVGMVRGIPEEFRLGMPIGRILDPAEQAHAVRFLAMPASSGITGQTIHVNGGQLMA